MVSDNDFDFINADFPCAAAPEFEGLFQPPFYKWYEEYTVDKIDAVHRHLETIIERDGPYDGVIGFSEGAAVAASMLLSRSNDDSSDTAPLFKIAVFFNAIAVLSPKSNLGRPLDRHDAAEILQASNELLVDAVPSSDSRVECMLDGIYAIGPDFNSKKIPIPTLHVIGRNDPFVARSRGLLQLCDTPLAVSISSVAGHEIPKAAGTLDNIAEKLDAMILAHEPH